MRQAKKQFRRLDVNIEALVRERLKPNERIEGWSEIRRDELMVRLIDEGLHSACEESVQKFGRGSGAGRILSFRLQDGMWVFSGIGGWIS